jgi:hypothetical protein
MVSLMRVFTGTAVAENNKRMNIIGAFHGTQ